MSDAGFPKRLARAWFLLRRRWGQRWLDPPWLYTLWTRLLREGGLEAQLLPPLSSSAPAAITEALTYEAENSFFFGSHDLPIFARRYPDEFPTATRQIIQEADDLPQGRLHYAGILIETEIPPRWYDTKAIAGMGK